MLEEFDGILSVTCDLIPHSLVTWYNKQTKKLVSNQLFYYHPEKMDDHVKIAAKDVDKFFAKAKESLKAFNDDLVDIINQITLFTSDQLHLGATEFLKLSSKTRKLYSYFTDFTSVQPQEEEKKEYPQPECFDWLFCNQNEDIPQQFQKSSVKNRDTKLLNIKVDIQNLEKWFEGRKFELERFYRATIDGFNQAGFRSKAHMKDNVVIVVESEHGKKFGGYTSHVILNTNNEDDYFLDTKSFIFSLSQKTKHKLI